MSVFGLIIAREQLHRDGFEIGLELTPLTPDEKLADRYGRRR